MLMNLIGFVIETNWSYNRSIITYRNPNTNAVGVFHCIKLFYGTLQRGGSIEIEIEEIEIEIEIEVAMMYIYAYVYVCRSSSSSSM